MTFRATPPPPTNALVGATIGRYRLQRVLGQGPAGITYLAEHLSIGSKVAIKILPLRVGEDDRRIAKVQADARAVSRLGHPNLVGLVDFGRIPSGNLCLVSEYLEGVTLEAGARGLLTASVVQLLEQLADGLAAAHTAGVVHRALNPSNILLCDGGAGQLVARIVDFGTAHASQNRLSRYASPEVAHELPAGPAADTYSVAAIAQDLLLDTFVQGGPLPFAVASVLNKALSTRPEARFESGPAFVTALRAALADSPRPATAWASPLGELATPYPVSTPALDPLQERALAHAGAGNWRGVARALAEGLPVERLAALREQFLEQHPLTLTLAVAFEKAGRHHALTQNYPLALKAIEKALESDPLNLSLHRRLEELAVLSGRARP